MTDVEAAVCIRCQNIATHIAHSTEDVAGAHAFEAPSAVARVKAAYAHRDAIFASEGKEVYSNADREELVTALIDAAPEMLRRCDPEDLDWVTELSQDEAFELTLKAYHCLKDQHYADARAELGFDDFSGKYYIKARVYGTVACRYRAALEKLAPSNWAARDALDWRNSESDGVPRADMAAFERTMQADAENARLKEHVRRLREALELALSCDTLDGEEDTQMEALLKETAE